MTKSQQAILTITPLMMRHFIIGQQGLYPGRRWRGQAGARQAMQTMGGVQIDPLNITARNHDLTLHSRVLDYDIAHLDVLAHPAKAEDRAAFDYGNLLYYYPIEDLPYFRTQMQNMHNHPSYHRWLTGHLGDGREEVFNFVREELRARGPLGNRDFEGKARVDSYRARKDTGIALHFMWMSGELMTHSRLRFERRLYFSDALVPAQYLREANIDESHNFFARKALKQMNIANMNEWLMRFRLLLEVQLSKPDAEKIARRLIERGEVTEIKIEGYKEPHYLLTEDLPVLEMLIGGKIPDSWQPADVTTLDEVTFLAPLDMVSARGRAKKVFDFEYIWEVYKPAHQRRWGYYCLPILYGDSLVGRIDPKMDRKANVLNINALWLEDTFKPDAQFADAFGKGLARFMKFNGADHVVFNVPLPASIKKRVEKHL